MFHRGVLHGLTGLLLLAGEGGIAQSMDTSGVARQEEDRVIVLDPGLSLGKPTLFLPPALHEERMFVVPRLVDEAAYAAGGVSFLLSGTPQAPDLMAPYRLQREREQELSTLRSVLGTVQLGAVGYVAYLHLKKRGVFR